MLKYVDSFLLVSQHQSFSAASRASDVSAVTLSRHIDALEADLGHVLFFRGPSGLALSPHGKAFLARVAPFAKGVSRVVDETRQLLGDGQSMPIRISATEPLLAELVAPRIGEFIDQEYLTIELRVENRPVNLSAYEAEIALRFAKPDGQDMRVKRLCFFDMGLWRARGPSLGMSHQNYVGYDDTYGEIPERVWMQSADLDGQVTVRTSSTRGILQIIRSGHAVGILPAIIAQKYPELERLTPPMPIPKRPLWMMMHPDVARQKPVRAAADWLSTLFAKLVSKESTSKT